MKSASFFILLTSLMVVTSACSKARLNNAEKRLASQSTGTTDNGINLAPVPGFVVAAGGGFASGTGIQVYATIGEVGGSAILTSPEMILVSGIQGATYDP